MRLARHARAALCVGLGILSGCTRPPGSLPLLHVPLSAIGVAGALEQRLVFTRAGVTRSIDAVVEPTPARLTMVATLLGVRLFDLQYDGRRARRITPGLPGAGFSTEIAVNDFLLIYAPEDAIRAALPRGFRLVATSTTRRVYRGDRLVVSIGCDVPGPIDAQCRLRDDVLGYDLAVISRIAL